MSFEKTDGLTKRYYKLLLVPTPLQKRIPKNNFILLGSTSCHGCVNWYVGTWIRRFCMRSRINVCLMRYFFKKIVTHQFFRCRKWCDDFFSKRSFFFFEIYCWLSFIGYRSRSFLHCQIDLVIPQDSFINLN